MTTNCAKDQGPPLTRPHSTHSTTICGVWCFKHFTNFSQSQRPSQS